MAKWLIVGAVIVVCVAFASLIAFQLIFDTSWQRIEKADFPWNGPSQRAAQYKKYTYKFPHTSSEEAWENRDGEMTPYWETFTTAQDCLRNSDLMKPIIRKSEIEPENTTYPYHFYLVSIDPEIVIVSVQAERPFDYYNMFVLPSTTIPHSTALYWFSPEHQPEPKTIELDTDGNGKFDIAHDVIEIHKNTDGSYSVLRVAG